jgi:hypothetical protein
MEKSYTYIIFKGNTEYRVHLKYVWNTAGKIARLNTVIMKKPAGSPEFTEISDTYYRHAGICNFFFSNMLLFRDDPGMEDNLRELVIPQIERHPELWRKLCFDAVIFDNTAQIAKIVLR